MNNSLANNTMAALQATTAQHAYRWGREADAARIYLQLADREKDNGHIAAEMEARRWAGNALMWNGQHDEALKVLMEVATCEHPGVAPESVYGAKTDCIMLLLHHAPAAVCRSLLDETRAYLERIGKPHWRHRLDLETSILLFRHGNYPEAAATAMQAYRLMLAATDGPRYVDMSHFKWIIRPLFFLREKKQLQEWLHRAEAETVAMYSDRMRLCCIRLFHERLCRAAGMASPGLAEVAHAIIPNAGQVSPMSDELFEIGRALMLAGDWSSLEKLPFERITAFPFERAKFAADREINSIRRKLQLTPWDADLNWPSDLPATLPNDSTISPSEANKLEIVLAELATAAQYEDQRLEATVCSEAANVRTRHAQALLRLSRLKPD